LDNAIFRNSLRSSTSLTLLQFFALVRLTMSLLTLRTLRLDAEATLALIGSQTSERASREITVRRTSHLTLTYLTLKLF
jgi:hypothetical protein